MTPIKKVLPSSPFVILSPTHANTAVTTTCTADGEICLFRKEEIFKVFIHETFHSLGLDFSSMSNTALNSKMKGIAHEHAQQQTALQDAEREDVQRPDGAPGSVLGHLLRSAAAARGRSVSENERGRHANLLAHGAGARGRAGQHARVQYRGDGTALL